MSLLKIILRQNAKIIFSRRINTKYLTQYRLFNDVPFEDIPSVTTSLIKKTLKLHNVQYDEGHTCYIAACPVCKLEKSSKVAKIYINKQTGAFSGPSCFHSGSWANLEAFIATPKTKKRKEFKFVETSVNDELELQQKIKELQESTLLIKEIPKEKLKAIFTRSKLPFDPNYEIMQIRADRSHINLYFPLENVEDRIVGYRILNSADLSQRTFPGSNCSGVLVEKSTKNKDTAVLVPNIADFLILVNSNSTFSTVCLPNGLLNLPPEILPSLERFNKLILWFGNNLTSWEAARNFAKKLGEKRCLFVRPTDKQSLPHLLAAPQEIKSILNGAQPIWHKSITTFGSLRQDVLSDLQNIDKVQGIKWKRYPSLNKILKGHRRGELTVVTGPTGSGKTTFISEYSLDLALQGVNTLWGSFEIRNVRLAKTMLQQLSGMPLDEHLDKFDFWADKFELLPIYFMTFHGQQSIKVVMEAVEHATYVHDIAHVIIDNVQFMMGTSEESRHMDRFWKQDSIIAAFRTFATRKNCHVTLVIHPRKERDEEELTTSSIFGGAKASQEADNVLIIQDKRLQSLRGKKYLQVAKNRYSGDLGIMPLDFNKDGLSYAQKKKANDEKKIARKVGEDGRAFKEGDEAVRSDTNDESLT